MFVVYLAHNHLTDKSYIGFTSQALERRACRHYSFAFSDRASPSCKFANAIRKYDRSAWTWTVLSEHATGREAQDAERVTIEAFDSYKSGYNSTIGMDGSFSRVVSTETRRKISESKIGSTLTSEHKEAISRASRGRMLSEEDKNSKATAARRRVYRNTKSGHTGVVQNGRKWAAYYNHSRRDRRYLGLFETLEEAVEARTLYVCSITIQEQVTS